MGVESLWIVASAQPRVHLIAAYIPTATSVRPLIRVHPAADHRPRVCAKYSVVERRAMMQRLRPLSILVGMAILVGCSASKENALEEEEEGSAQHAIVFGCLPFGHDPFPPLSDPYWYTRDGALVREQS